MTFVTEVLHGGTKRQLPLELRRLLEILPLQISIVPSGEKLLPSESGHLHIES